MSEENEESRFLIYTPGVIAHLEDRDFFVRAISQFYDLIATQRGWNLSLSQRRLFEAHDMWLNATQRALDYDTDQYTTTLDHFKHGAFIAYSLQRTVPISDILAPKGPGGKRAPVTSPSAQQIHFARYGNEICALNAGFCICLSYETHALAKRRGIDPNEIALSQLPAYLQSEFPRLVKHKDIAPEALYMTLRSLFDSLMWEIGPQERGAA